MESMRKALLVIMMLCIAGASAAQDLRPSDARPSMPYTGTATMLNDGTLALRLRLASDSTPANDIFTYKVGDRAYDDILRHLGGLRPGETKPFSPWKD
jgi:hypothetical protein